METLEGLLEELGNYERRLAEAQMKGDEDMVRNLEEKIRRVKVKIDNLRNYEKTFGRK